MLGRVTIPPRRVPVLGRCSGDAARLIIRSLGSPRATARRLVALAYQHQTSVFHPLRERVGPCT